MNQYDPLAKVVMWALKAAAPGSVLMREAEAAEKELDRERPRLTPSDPRCKSGQGGGSIRGCVNEPGHPGSHNWID